MSYRLPLTFVALLAAVCGVAAQQCPEFRLQSLPALAPTACNISVVDGRFYCYSGAVLYASEPRSGALTYVEGDTVVWHHDARMNYVVRCGSNGNIFYTVPGSRGSSALYELVPRRGKEPKAKRHRLGLSVSHPTFTADGSVMVFASNEEGGYGGSDLWYSLRDDDGDWRKPQPLPSSINGSGDETVPVIWDDYLIFASRPAEGGATRLRCTRLVTPQSQLVVASMKPTVGRQPVEEMPEPFGSGDDDFELAVDTTAGCLYLISRRDGARGLYMLSSPLPLIALAGTVTDANSRPMDGVTLSLFRGNSLLCRTQSNEEGRYRFLLHGGEHYTVWLTKAGYFGNTIDITAGLDRNDRIVPEVIEDVRLDQLDLNNIIYIDDIFGADADIELSENGCYKLQRIVRFLYENPQIVMEATLLSPVTTNAEFNRLLTDRRIATLQRYLKAQLPGSKVILSNGHAGNAMSVISSYNSQLAIRLR